MKRWGPQDLCITLQAGGSHWRTEQPGDMISSVFWEKWFGNSGETKSRGCRRCSKEERRPRRPGVDALRTWSWLDKQQLGKGRIQQLFIP